MDRVNELINLKEKGYFIIKDFATFAECDEIAKTLDGNNNITINNNELNVTKLNSTLFNKHAIAISKAAFNVVTSSDILDISEDYFGSAPILKCSRSYAISKFHHLFPWHADNKSPIDSVTDNSKGLVFILYLEDDFEGTFSLSIKSWNPSNNKKVLPTLNQLKDWEDKGFIIQIKAKKGDLLGFSQDIFHRHITKNSNLVKAFWFQVISQEEGVSERILINPRFIKGKNTEKILNFLSSGEEVINYSQPITSMKSIDFITNTKYIILLLLNLPLSLFKSFKAISAIILPKFLVERIRYR